VRQTPAVVVTQSSRQLHLNVGFHPVVISTICEHSVLFDIVLLTEFDFVTVQKQLHARKLDSSVPDCQLYKQ